MSTSMSPCVLIYGHDTHLLETRQWMLERCCLDVHSVTELSDVDDVTLQRRVDLFIMCHSLSLEECAAALDLGHSRWPQMKYMVLTATDSPCAATPVDIVVDTNDGPRTLVAVVERLLHGHAAPTVVN